MKRLGILMGVILKCIFTSLPSTRHFGSSLVSGSIGTPKLSEKEARALPGWVTHWECADKDVGPLKGVDCNIPHRPGDTRRFGSSLALGYVGTPKLSEKEARTLTGWVTHWEVAREFPKTKP
ncbi:hypothetical protein DVH24_007630 [Malus domestica]|uniref:Uncharacterized protein n=1 Tax=Malus domestica TaxID=3750 RepID=A0A498HJ75_MALDO|nr:hypothetical protein DVH24_007630 [Malus domestica]